MRILKFHSAENVKRGDPLGFFNIHPFTCKISKKLKGDPLETLKNFRKAEEREGKKGWESHIAEKLEKTLQSVKEFASEIKSKFRFCAIFSNLRVLFGETQFTSTITSKFGYSAKFSNIPLLLSRRQFTSDITSKVRV